MCEAVCCLCLISLLTCCYAQQVPRHADGRLCAPSDAADHVAASEGPSRTRCTLPVESLKSMLVIAPRTCPTLQLSTCMHVCTLRRRPQESAALRPSAKANELHVAGSEEAVMKRKAPTANPFARKQKAPKA